MSEQQTRSSRRAWLLIGAIAVALIVGLGVIVGYPSNDPDPSPPSTSPPTTGQEPRGVEVRDEASLTVPQTLRSANGSFDTVQGQKYLLRFEVSTMKPEGSAGAAMYLGVSLNCVGEGGGRTRSIGGTQNLVTGEPTTLSNQFVLVGGGEAQSCNVSMSAPYDEVAAAGVTIEADVRWSAQPIDPSSFEISAEERLPTEVPVGGRELAFTRTIDLDEVRGRSVNVFGTLHLTACTGVNGSREDGKTWCDATTADSGGSEVDLVLRADLLDAEGRPCGEVAVQADALHIDRFTHHRLTTFSHEAVVPEDACGVSLRFSLTVATQGPAPVVVHSSASSFVVVNGEFRGEGNLETD